MMKDVVLKVENLGKNYKIYRNPIDRIKEWLTFGKRNYHKQFQALSDISFEVRRGDFLGVIGPNGAGKSTLLKVLTGVLEPSSGAFKTSGKVLSLLELNGGMDDNLSGRENIIRSAQLLGFPSGYLVDRMEQIEEFAELGVFFDQALSVYSSGMRIRLAFSMFAFLECDILILDEVLAVGDIFFRQKCYRRLEELIKQNTAVILVTHSTGTVRQFCDEVIVLQNGAVIYKGSSDVAIQKYFQIKKDQGVSINVSDTYMEEDYITSENVSLVSDSGDLEWPSELLFKKNTLPQKSENDHVKLIQLLVCDEHGSPCQVFKQGETAWFYFAYQIKENMGVPIAGISLFTATNLLIHSKNSLQLNASHPLMIRQNDTIRFRQRMRLDVAPGRYIFNINMSTMHPSDFDQKEILSAMEFKEKMISVIGINPAGALEVIQQSQNQALGLHGGLCNLDGEMNIQIVRTM